MLQQGLLPLLLLLPYSPFSDGEGVGGQAEEASAFDFPLPPLVFVLPEKPGTCLWTQGLLLLQPVSVANLMGCSGLLSALEDGWADGAHGPRSTSLHFSPGKFGLFLMGFQHNNYSLKFFEYCLGICGV